MPLYRALVLATVVLVPAIARADEKPHGAVVVSVGDSAEAAKALAHDVYRDELLRPAIDEATARVLTGDPAPQDAARPLKETAELRASIEKAESDVIARRLLAQIGSEAHAEVVVEVVIDAGRPIAKVLKVSTAAFAPVELGATVATADTGAKSFTWPGATGSLHAFVAVPPPVVPPAPSPAIKPKKDETPTPVKAPSFAWTSPWFWASLGVLTAAGVTVFVFAKSSSGASGNYHLSGQVPE